MVRILVLVDKDIMKFPLVILPHLRELLQEPDGMENNIVKVQRPGGPELFLIGQVDVSNFLQTEIPLGLGLVQKFLRQLHIVLRP